MKRKNKGFTLAELLVVIAITGILAAVGFIAVTRYMRILKHLEYDAIAKEMFITAQNHLSMANNEGYLGVTDFGTDEVKIDGLEYTYDEGVYYYVLPRDKAKLNDENSMLNLIMPFGSIDDTLRDGGSYIIRYNKETAQILDVFYSDQAGTRYGHTFKDLYDERNSENILLMNIRDDAEGSNENKLRRRNYLAETGGRTSIVGFYGGASANPEFGSRIPLPFVMVNNAEDLSVTVKTRDLPKSAELKLYVKGKLSNAIEVITLKQSGDDDVLEYKAVLDSITSATESENHFARLFGSKGFIPGENLLIYAVAEDKTVLTNVAKTVGATTNSLFGDLSNIEQAGISTDYIADISNMRHLENLHKAISNLDTVNIHLAEARQNVDLDWNDFLNKASSNVVYGHEPGKILATNGNYYPVDLPTGYNGQNHKISNVAVNTAGSAGLFGDVSQKAINDLELNDFTIRSTGYYAGALAGTVNNSNIRNVVAKDNTIRSSVIGSTGAGGLIGLSSGSSTVEYSAASLMVTGGSYGGGLIGNSSGTTITNSYAGGHTVDGRYDTNNINVKATNYAGGLIGYSSSTSINNTYSTCSVDGNYAGGLLGYYSGSAISNSYSTGYVKINDPNNLTNKGAFIGFDASNASHSNCNYLRIVNNDLLKPIFNKDTSTIRAIDFDLNSYNNFVRLNITADAYDAYLTNHYKNKFEYKGIGDLSDVPLQSKYYVNTHYGDWPSYETLVINDR